MLQSFYLNMGFVGALLFSLVIFLLFICWIAGIAGITLPVDGGKPRGSAWQIVVSMVFPPYPICWMMFVMNEQRKFLKNSKNNLRT